MANLLSFRSPEITEGSTIGLSAYGRARDTGLTAQQIYDLAGQQNVRFGSGLRPQILDDVLLDVSAGFKNKYDSLNESFSQQASAFNAAQTSYQNQLSQQQQQSAELQAQFANLQRAQVPQAERTAKENRVDGSKATSKRQSGLSSLAIVSGLGTQTNPLSGLQLA